MMIIVEGTDGTGKTTLCKLLSEKLDYRIIKGSSFENAKLPQDQLFGWFTFVATKQNVIVDRFFPSNLTYAPLYKDYSMIDKKQTKFLESMIRDKAIIIYLYADINTLKSRIRERGDDYVKEDRLEEISKKYEEVLINSSLDVISVDTSVYSTHEIMDIVMKSLNAKISNVPRGTFGSVSHEKKN